MPRKPDDKVFGPKTKRYVGKMISSIERVLPMAKAIVETLEIEDVDGVGDLEGVGDSYSDRKVVAAVFERLGEICKRIDSVIKFDHIDRLKDLLDLMKKNLDAPEDEEELPPPDEDGFPPPELGEPVGVNHGMKRS